MARFDEEPPGVLVLYNASQELAKGEPQDMIAELGVVACAWAVSRALEEAGYRVVLVPLQTELETALAPYPPTEYVVFNFGEGLKGQLLECSATQLRFQMLFYPVSLSLSSSSRWLRTLAWG